MTTEFSIAVANIDHAKCQDLLFNDYDIVVDTSNKAQLNQNGRWMMENESARRNIFMWGTDKYIDDAIQGIPGNESYLRVADSIDSVLGELVDENLEEREKIQTRVLQQLKWSMNMQSQEWTKGSQLRPTIECKFGNIYARDHHFESSIFYRNPIRNKYCEHNNFRYFNEHIFSDLHCIVQNTIYLIDYTFKVRCKDNEPYRNTIGTIFPYFHVTKDKYVEFQDAQIFRSNFNTFKNFKKDKNRNNVYIKDDVESDPTPLLYNEDEENDLKKTLDDYRNKILEYEHYKKNSNSAVENINISNKLKELRKEAEEVEGKIKQLIEISSSCQMIKPREINIENDIEETVYKSVESDYDPKESRLNRDEDITYVFNGQIKHALYKKIDKDGKIPTCNTVIDMSKAKTSDKIQEVYDDIEDQYAKDKNKWLDIKRYTFGYYEEKDNYIGGYGPLQVEGTLDSKKMEYYRGSEHATDVGALIDHGGQDVKPIDPLKLCKFFSQYSRDRPNDQIVFKDDPDICEKFKKSINQLFNLGKANEQAAIDRIHREGWTVHPISKEAFHNINNMQRPSYEKNIAKLAILISQIYGGYVDHKCPIHVLRGGMMFADSCFGNTYSLLKKKFNWDIYKAEHRMGWNVPKANMKIRPLTRMNVYTNKFIKGRAGVCWNIHWNSEVKVDPIMGYPHFKEEINITQSYFVTDHVNTYYQKMLNAEKWEEIDLSIEDLINLESRFYSKDISKDFYLDDKGLLVTPSYYGEQIYYNIISSCNYKCVSTATYRTTEDKNEFKHTAAQRLLVPDNWFYPFQNEYDMALITEGRAIYTTQQARGRLERTYTDTYSRNKDFQNYINITEKDIVDNVCPITYSSMYIPWRFYVMLFSLYINFMPVHVRNSVQHNDISIYPYIQTYDIDYKCSSVYSAIYNVFKYAYNAKNLKNERDVYHFLRFYQSAKGEIKLQMIKNNIPVMYDLITNHTGTNVDEYFVINFLFLLNCVNINSQLNQDSFLPICYCRSSNILLTSIKISKNMRKNFSSHYFPYLSRFFGIQQHKKWRNTNELLFNIRGKAIQYYIGEIIISIPPELSINQTKSQNIAMWVGSKCGGVSEALLFFQAITYPRAAYILILLGDDAMNYDDMIREIRSNYQTSFNSCKGIVLCQIKDDLIVDYKIIGTIKARKMNRIFWGLSHEMLLIKSPGDIFGNVHIVTKLMNI
uniref:Outer capsid protein VP2 n=1 Tax=Changuinola virus TaxID=40052 RepID=U5YL70_9REOV|nr:outer capsid protein VP2 [Changuinola virus]